MMKSSSLKILMITARADFGGGPQHIYLLIKELKNKFDFYIACPDDFPYKLRFEELIGAEKIIIIPHRKFTVSALNKLKAYSKRERIDIIHSHGKGAGIYGRLLSFLTSIPCLHTFHGLHIDNYNTLQKNLYINTERFLSAFTKNFITVSESEFEKLKNHRIAPSNKILLVENGVDTSEMIDRDKIMSGEIYQLITLTRFDYAKNSELLIPIMEHLRQSGKIKKFRLLILGSGPGEKKIREEIDNRSLNKYVVFKGAVTNPNEYLKESFCYISTSRWEGMPLGVLEAMSLGVPVLATNVTGNKDLVKHEETGYLFELNSPEHAANFIIELAENKSKWYAFSQSAKKIITENFSVEKMGDKTSDIYLSIISGSTK